MKTCRFAVYTTIHLRFVIFHAAFCCGYVCNSALWKGEVHFHADINLRFVIHCSHCSTSWGVFDWLLLGVLGEQIQLGC